MYVNIVMLVVSTIHIDIRLLTIGAILIAALNICVLHFSIAIARLVPIGMGYYQQPES